MMLLKVLLRRIKNLAIYYLHSSASKHNSTRILTDKNILSTVADTTSTTCLSSGLFIHEGLCVLIIIIIQMGYAIQLDTLATA